MNRLTRLAAVVAAMLQLAACSGTIDAYEAASGLEETAFVMNQHYLALVKEANRLAGEQLLTGSALGEAQMIVRKSRPLLATLSEAARAYEAVANAATEGDLRDAIADAAVALSDLIDAIRAVGGTAAVPVELDDVYGVAA